MILFIYLFIYLKPKCSLSSFTTIYAKILRNAIRHLYIDSKESKNWQIILYTLVLHYITYARVHNCMKEKYTVELFLVTMTGAEWWGASATSAPKQLVDK